MMIQLTIEEIFPSNAIHISPPTRERRLSRVERSAFLSALGKSRRKIRIRYSPFVAAAAARHP